MNNLIYEAKKQALSDIKKYEGSKINRFSGRSGYKREGYSPFKKEIRNGKEISFFDPYDAPYDYNFLLGKCISDSNKEYNKKYKVK